MIDLYQTVKAGKSKVDPKVFKESVFDLFTRTLKQGGLTDEQKQTIAQIRAMIEIKLRNW